jgi:NitT/TauT family transport system substrate-binding protein
MSLVRWDRRRFGTVLGASALAAAALPLHAAEPPPETTRIRISDSPVACLAPLYVAEALLKAEGFTEVEYVETPATAFNKTLASGQVDMSQNDAAAYMMSLDRGEPIVVLGGVHTGCWELFAQTSIRSVRELKGKKVAASDPSTKAWVTAMIAWVGLDPHKDVRWVHHEPDATMKLFEQGQIDAMLGFVPEPQELRARKIGHVLVNTLTDKPWSQYFCCLAAGNREFVRKNPVATKRALRALLKAVDLCASQPEAAARLMFGKGASANYDYVLQSVKDSGYRRWREYSAEDTMRFWGLRLREAGIIKGDPKKLLAQGTDWRFIEQLKKEMKS